MPESEFEYLIDKVVESDFSNEPFRHIEIHDFLSDDHFNEIVSSPEICLPPAASDGELCEALLMAGWEPVKFPGGTTSVTDYLKWRNGSAGYDNVETCEGFGIVFRLARPKTALVERLDSFVRGERFLASLAEKFDIDRSAVVSDVGIQKYLDGYEISPHPDIRTKALTFMVNINPHADSEFCDHHTHYLSFEDRWRYVEEFWRHNPQFDRCWVPWSWCTTVKQQAINNSIVIFSPDCDTIHAVRAKYDHLKAQRTQLYGNLWYGSSMDVVFERQLPQIPWQGLQIDEKRGSQMLRTTPRGKRLLSGLVDRLSGR